MSSPRASSMGLQTHFMAVLVSFTLFIAAPHSTQAQEERKLVHESPYYLPGLSNIPFNFSGDSSEGSGAFRVLGASTDGLSLSFTHAEASCRALTGGKGLALVNTAQRRATLTSAIIKSLDSLLKAENGTEAELHWVGGWRTSLSDENCTTSANPSWPFFTSPPGVQGGAAEATDYNGCGTDPLQDWVWRKWLDEDRMVEEPFQSNPGVQNWWEDSSITGIGNVHEPSGWAGPYNLAQGDRYENCTTARVYTRTRHGKEVQPAAASKAWLNDGLCTKTLQRWICEMESASVGSSALTAPGATGLGKVADSPFYISGVSDTPHPANNYKSTVGSVYRVLGVPPAADANFEFERYSHVLTWEDAQQACLDMGGLALAAPAKPAVDKPAFSFLKGVSDTLISAAGGETLPAFWMSAVYLSPTETQGENIAASSGWTWFPTVARGGTQNLLLSNSSAEWPMAANETRWENGYPKPGIFVKEPNLPVQSCAAAVWPEGDTGERWRNYACSSHDVRYFICRFPDASTGMPKGNAAAEQSRERGGLLGKLSFDREILLIIFIASLALMAMLCCCSCFISNRCKAEGTVVVSSVQHILARHNSKANTKGVSCTYSLDPLRKSGAYVLGGKDSLGGGKWGELPEIAENEAIGGERPGQIRAKGSIPHRPQVLRENAGGPQTFDSIDAATRCMRASSYWSLAESMETEVVANSMQDTVVDVGSGGKGMKHMQAHFERMGRLDISDPPSEPPQAANDCEPTVARSPGVATSPALASSPESVGMRIPAALCWSLSPRSKEPSADGRTSADGQTKRQGAGGKLLQRLRSAARRAGRASDIVEHGQQHNQHNQQHMQTSRSPRQSPRPSTTGCTTVDASTSPSRSPPRYSTPANAPHSIESHSNFSPPSSQREFVGEEKWRTADGNMVTTHVFRRSSPQISPESSFVEEPRPSSFHAAAPPQLTIPSDPITNTTADQPLSSHSRKQSSSREPSPRLAKAPRNSQNDTYGVVYACEQYPPSPEACNDLEPGPREDSGGVIDILRGSYPPPPNFCSVVPSPTGSMPRHSSVQTTGSNQTMGSISVFTAEPSLASLSKEGPRHRMGPALPRYTSNALTSKKYFSGQGKPDNNTTNNSLEFPRGDSTTTAMSVSTPWHRINNNAVVAAGVNTSSDLLPLSESGSAYHPARTDSPPPALGPKHSHGDVGVPTPASSRYAPKFQSSPEPQISPKPPLSYLTSSHTRVSIPKSPTSPAPRPGRPHTLDASIDYQPQSIWSQVTPQEISEGLEAAGSFGPPTQITALQHFSGSTASGPTTSRHAENTRSVLSSLSSPEITTFFANSARANSSSNVFSMNNLPSPQKNGLATCGSNSQPSCSSPSQWTLESSEFGWQARHATATSNDNSNQDSLAAAVAARTCVSPQSCRSSGAGPIPVSSIAAPHSMQPTSGTLPSTHRSSVTSLDSTAGMRGRLPTLPENLDEEGSAALVDAWLTSLKVDEGAQEAIVRLATSLDGLSVDAAKGEFGTVMGQFKLLGPVERVVGGQGVVQFAKMLKVEPSIISAPEPQVALKFYVQPELIRVETAVYGSPTLATYGVLPRSAQLHLNTWKELQTTTGASLPPCLVMERGMSLKEWMIHSRMSTNTLASDCKTAIKALLHLSQCLVALHSSGFVHRDLKPGAVLWLPSEHRWALVNFCRAARIGADTPAPCSLAYAAPEVAANASYSSSGGVHAGAEPMRASPASDAWSLGIVALELFSRTRALDVHSMGVPTVLDQLQGNAPLPWERENGLRCLGPLADCVRRLLKREPYSRPTVADFVRDATAALESVST